MNSNRWHNFQQIYSQLKDMSGNVPLQYDGRVDMLIDKMDRIAEMKRNLNQQDYLLKKQYMKLMREKSMFASQLTEITLIGNNLEWEEKSGILQRIKPMLDATKHKLRSESKPLVNESRVSTQHQN